MLMHSHHIRNRSHIALGVYNAVLFKANPAIHSPYCYFVYIVESECGYEAYGDTVSIPSECPIR